MLGIKKLSRAVKDLTATLRPGVDAFVETCTTIRQTLDLVILVLIRFILPPSPIGSFEIESLIESENGMIKATLKLPKLPTDADPEDTKNGLARFSYDGADQTPIETKVGDETLTLMLPKNTNVAGSFVFVDFAGNESANALILTPFTALDTTPPSDPVGDFKATSFEELPDDPPAETKGA